MGFQVVHVECAGEDWYHGPYEITLLVNSQALSPGDVLRYLADPKQKYPPQSAAKRLNK